MHLPFYYHFITSDILIFLFIFFPTSAEDMKLNKSNQLFCCPVDETTDFIFLGLKSALELISFFLSTWKHQERWCNTSSSS